jgi:hypothetical protein
MWLASDFKRAPRPEPCSSSLFVQFNRCIKQPRSRFQGSFDLIQKALGQSKHLCVFSFGACLCRWHKCICWAKLKPKGPKGEGGQIFPCACPLPLPWDPWAAPGVPWAGSRGVHGLREPGTSGGPNGSIPRPGAFRHV